MYIIENLQQLTTERISKIIQDFCTSKLPKMQKQKNYYDGKQAILNRTMTDEYKPNNRIVTNYCKYIIDNYAGYILGIPAAYSSTQASWAEIQGVLNYNDVADTDLELLNNALIYGTAYELEYLDETATERFKVLNSMECIPIYDNTLNENLLAVIRFYRINDILNTNIDKYKIEIYDSRNITIYNASNNFFTLQLEEIRQHYFKQCPVVVYNIGGSIIDDAIITLQDAYNVLLSDEINDFSAFVDAYLCLKGINAEEEDIAKMKENRVLLLDTDSSADFLTKNIADTQIENIKQNINDNIHKISASPDFNDEKLLAQSGIAMRYKIVGFENRASKIVRKLQKALQKRIELICEIMGLTGTDATWRDVKITFTRNLPVNTLEAASIVNTLRGVVSDRTLIAQLPFIEDVEGELEQLTKEQEGKASLYTFGADLNG